MPETSNEQRRRLWPVGAALAMAVGAGIAATVFSAVVILVARAGSSFLDRVDLVAPVVLERWEGRLVWLLAIVVVAISIRAGIVLGSDVPAARVWSAMLIGLGFGLVLSSSPLWPAAAAGAGWGFGIGRNPVEMASAAGAGLVVTLFGYGVEEGSLTDSAVQGVIAMAIVALLLTAAAMIRDRWFGPRTPA